jgi:hypothetical protein
VLVGLACRWAAVESPSESSPRQHVVLIGHDVGSYAPRRPDFFEVECGLPPGMGAGFTGFTFGSETSATGAPGRLVEKSGIA